MSEENPEDLDAFSQCWHKDCVHGDCDGINHGDINGREWQET